MLATVVDGPGAGDSLLLIAGSEPRGGLANADLQRVVQRDAEAALAAGTTSVRRYGDCGEANEDTVTVFIEAFAPPPRLLVFGAVDFTAALVRVAKVLGFHVTVCDAREVFATKARFPLADEVVVDWPHRYLAEVGASLGPRDAVCVLTHDAKFDVPAIRAALDTDVGYLGAMGSRRTTEQRAERLRARGRHRRAARSAAGAHRAGPRGAHARGDRGGHLRGDHRPPHRSRARPASATGRVPSTESPAPTRRVGAAHGSGPPRP